MAKANTQRKPNGNADEIIGKFSGADKLRNAMNQLQSLPYAT